MCFGEVLSRYVGFIWFSELSMPFSVFGDFWAIQIKNNGHLHPNTEYWLLESILKLIWIAFNGKFARFICERWNGPSMKMNKHEMINKSCKTNKLVTASTINECQWKIQLGILVMWSHLSFHAHVLKWVQCAHIGHLSDQNKTHSNASSQEQQQRLFTTIAKCWNSFEILSIC